MGCERSEKQPRRLPSGHRATNMSTTWLRSGGSEADALPLANRHYNRQTLESPQFAPPGRLLVLLTADKGALCVTSWPEYAQHVWRGAWVNTLFRRESGPLASDLIREAVSLTCGKWPEIPPLGMVTFVDAGKVKSKRDPGRCYRRAGFKHVGFTQGGLWVFQMLPSDMPAPLFLAGSQLALDLPPRGAGNPGVV